MAVRNTLRNPYILEERASLTVRRAARMRNFRAQGRHAAALMDSWVASGEIELWLLSRDASDDERDRGDDPA
eukprot:4836123-Heterocapsa_arctica.AAC.1